MKIKLTEDDFDITWFSGTGNGGQHRNKHQNCCRITHRATGITAVGQRERSREGNRKAAMSVCRARVIALLTPKTERFRAGDERVRTYHEPDNRVIDHASGKTLRYNEALSDITFLVEARKLALSSHGQP